MRREKNDRAIGLDWLLSDGCCLSAWIERYRWVGAKTNACCFEMTNTSAR